MQGTSLHLLNRILKVYVKVLTGFSLIFSPDDPNSSSLTQGCTLQAAPLSMDSPQGNRGKNIHSRDKGGVRCQLASHLAMSFWSFSSTFCQTTKCKCYPIRSHLFVTLICNGAPPCIFCTILLFSELSISIFMLLCYNNQL